MMFVPFLIHFKRDKSVMEIPGVFTSIFIFTFIILFVMSSVNASESISCEEYRRTGGNSFVKLTDGWTNYELIGDPDAAHTVILIHGGTIPLCIWETQIDALKNAGFRILRYDQFGRGYSDRPAAIYSRELFLRQLKDLLDALDIKKPVDIVGPSFGGAIAVTFAAKYPQRVNSMLLISPALNILNSDSPLTGPIKLMRLPLLGKLIYNTIIKNKLIRRAEIMVPGGIGSPCHSNFIDQFKCKGTGRALLSMFKSDAFGDYRELTRTSGKSIKKVLLLRGKADKEITHQMINQIREDLPDCKFMELDNSGHSPGTDAADTLNKIIIDFITDSK